MRCCSVCITRICKTERFNVFEKAIEAFVIEVFRYWLLVNGRIWQFREFFDGWLVEWLVWHVAGFAKGEGFK